MKKLIGSVVIFGQKWKIYEHKDLPDNINGYCYPHEKVIHIRHGLDKATFRKIYIHELVHSALCEMEFFVTGMDGQAEEILVNQLAIIISKNFDTIAKHLK